MKKKDVLQAVKYGLIAASAGIIQSASFALFEEVLHWEYWPSYLVALILSVLWNFTFNRKAVFRSDAPLSITVARYYILWAFQLLASYGLVALLTKPFGDSLTAQGVFKLIVDIFLYFISFRVQQAWVFKPAKEK